METFLSALAVTAITALSWIAWHEPKTFERLHVPIQRALFCVVAFALGYNIAILQVLYTPERFDDVSGENLAKSITESLIEPSVFIIVIGIMAYLTLLWLLPVIRDGSGKRGKKQIDRENVDGES